MSSPKAPKATQSQLAQEAAQATASSLLDQQENERRKRLLNAAAGLRAFSGSALSRAVPGNTPQTTAATQNAPTAIQMNVPGSAFLSTARGGVTAGTKQA